MIRENRPDPECLVTSYEPSQDIEEATMSAAEARKIDASRYDYLLAPIWDRYAYRSADGEWIERPLRCSGMGDVALDIIRALQVNAGVVQTRTDIAYLINDEEYCGAWPLPARMRMIRKAHDESGSNQRMFLSDANGGYYWHRDLSWCWVERAPKDSSSDGTAE